MLLSGHQILLDRSKVPIPRPKPLRRSMRGSYATVMRDNHK